MFVSRVIGYGVIAFQDIDELVDTFGSGGITWQEWLRAGIVLVVAIVAARLVSRVAGRGLDRAGLPTYAATILGRFSGYLIGIVGFVYALNSLGVDLVPLLGALGLAGLALALAFQDLAENLIAGFMLLIRRPFIPGEEIRTGDHAGVVEDVNLRAVVIRRYDGDLVHIPNASVLTDPLENLTRRPIRRTTLAVGVAYATDLDRAGEVILEAVRPIEGVLEDPAPDALVHQFGASSIDFAVRYWHASDIVTVWRVRDRVARAVKQAFDRAGIEIPFPQRTLWIDPASAPLRVSQPDTERSED